MVKKITKHKTLQIFSQNLQISSISKKRGIKYSDRGVLFCSGDARKKTFFFFGMRSLMLIIITMKNYWTYPIGDTGGGNEIVGSDGGEGGGDDHHDYDHYHNDLCDYLCDSCDNDHGVRPDNVHVGKRVLMCDIVNIHPQRC